MTQSPSPLLRPYLQPPAPLAYERENVKSTGWDSSVLPEADRAVTVKVNFCPDQAKGSCPKSCPLPTYAKREVYGVMPGGRTGSP